MKKMLNKIWGVSKKVLPFILVFALGLGLLPAIELGQQYYDVYQFGETVETDVRYKIIEQFESLCPGFFVINIDAGEKYVSAWIMVDERTFPQSSESDKVATYYFGSIAQLAVVLEEYYPGRTLYEIILASVISVPGLEGTSVWVAYAQEAYMLSAGGIGDLSELTDNEARLEKLNELYVSGHFTFTPVYMYYGPTGAPYTGVVLDRGPKFIYPWEWRAAQSS